MFLSYYDLQMHCFVLYIQLCTRLNGKTGPFYVILNFQEHFVPAENKKNACATDINATDINATDMSVCRRSSHHRITEPCVWIQSSSEILELVAEPISLFKLNHSFRKTEAQQKRI